MSFDRLQGPLPGVVASRADPEKRGRITARVPGVFDGEDLDDDHASPWLKPLATGGLGDGRGRLEVPEVGAEVVVFLVYDPAIDRGDPDVAYYLASNYGTDDVPDELGHEDVFGVVYRDYLIVVDERPLEERGDTPSLRVVHRVAGDGLVHDADTLKAEVRATAGVKVSSPGRVEATGGVLILNGRYVVPDAGPIV